MKKIICFSGGHSSALAAIETARKYGTEGMVLLNHDISPHVEHEDIKRFKREVAEYIGLTITYANMPGWETMPPLAVAVANKAFKAFNHPAFCTSRLKTEPFYKWLEENGELVVRAAVKDEIIFAGKLRLDREIRVSLSENAFMIHDRIENTGDRVQPFEILYHMNMGYPLLDEDSVVEIPSADVTPRDAHAAEDIKNWMRMTKPEAGYTERCYYHKFEKEGRASVKVLKTPDKWFGVTYKEDKQSVVDSLGALIAKGEYPEKLY